MQCAFSLITPTFERHSFLRALYGSILKQSSTLPWEWLIFDMSDKPSSFFTSLKDERVRYRHHPKRLSIGMARNKLKKEARGEIIVHFDDDDYYAPSYLSVVWQELQKHDFFNIHSWFNYDVKSHQFYYWATEVPAESVFVLDPFTGMRTREIDFGPLMKEKQDREIREKGFRGYGFSYAYRKEVSKACLFPNINLKEDSGFYNKVEKKGFSMKVLPDERGLVVKIIHDDNISGVYPQFRLPPFLLHQLFPDFASFLSTYPQPIVDSVQNFTFSPTRKPRD